MPSKSYFQSFWTSNSDEDDGGVGVEINMEDMNDLTRSLPAIPGQPNAETDANSISPEAGGDGVGDDVNMEELEEMPELLPAAASGLTGPRDTDSSTDRLDAPGTPDIVMSDTDKDDMAARFRPAGAQAFLDLEAKGAQRPTVSSKAPDNVDMDTAEDTISPTLSMSNAPIAVEPVDQGALTGQDLYANIYGGKILPLAQLCEPEDCVQDPRNKLEIIEAYMRWTTFTVPIWINFDAADLQFYTDKRAEDCGKLHLATHVRTRLESLNPSLYKFQDIRLQVSTPFRTLAEYSITIPQTAEGGEIRVQAHPVHAFSDGTPNWLYPYLGSCTVKIRKVLRGGKSRAGLTLQDLDDIARLFRRNPTQEDEGARIWYGRGDWYLWAEYEEPVVERRFLRGGMLGEWRGG